MPLPHILRSKSLMACPVCKTDLEKVDGLAILLALVVGNLVLLVPPFIPHLYEAIAASVGQAASVPVFFAIWIIVGIPVSSAVAALVYLGIVNVKKRA